MLKNNPFLDDMAKFASSAAGSVMELKREIEAIVTAKLESLVAKMQLVSRDEFETVRLMALKAREENENLKEQIEHLQSKLDSRL